MHFLASQATLKNQNMPGIFKPFVNCPIVCSVFSSICFITSLIAVKIKSCSISTSSGSTASSLILTSRIFLLPSAMTVTMPPPTDASNSISNNSSCAFIIFFCIFCICFIILPMFPMPFMCNSSLKIYVLYVLFMLRLIADFQYVIPDKLASFFDDRVLGGLMILLGFFLLLDIFRPHLFPIFFRNRNDGEMMRYCICQRRFDHFFMLQK